MLTENLNFERGLKNNLKKVLINFFLEYGKSHNFVHERSSSIFFINQKKASHSIEKILIWLRIID